MATRFATFVLIIGLIIAGYEACDYREMNGQLQNVMKTYNTTPILQYCGKLWDIREKTYSCNASNQSFVEQLNEAERVCGECKLNTLQCSQLPINCSGYSSCCSLYNESVECLRTRGCPPEVLFTRYKHEQDVFCKTTEGRIPCPGAAVCVKGLQQAASISFSAVCRYVDTFVTCVDGALDKCGDDSKVSSQYTLSDVADNFKAFCQVVEPAITSCSAMASCLVLSNDQSTGADLNKFTDQTYWSKEVKRMVTCVSDADCEKSDALVKKLESLKDNIQELQARDINSAVPFALPGVLTMLMVVLVAITIN